MQYNCIFKNNCIFELWGVWIEFYIWWAMSWSTKIGTLQISSLSYKNLKINVIFSDIPRSPFKPEIPGSPLDPGKPYK